MKIIGKTDRGFILDASSQEVANLAGFYSDYRMGHVKVGAEIEVHHMYDQLYKLSHMEKEIGQIADSLEKYALALRPIMPIHIEATTEGEKKEER